MVKLLLVGLWVCGVSLGASYAAIMWQADVPVDPQADEFFGGLDYVKTDPISVPLLAEGEIKGYIIARFVFTVDGAVLRRLSVPPNVFIVDEAYRVLYAEGHKIDFKKLAKHDLEKLTQDIRAKVNERFKSELIKEVLVEQLSYLTREEIRNNTFNVVKTPAKAESPAQSDH